MNDETQAPPCLADILRTVIAELDLTQSQILSAVLSVVGPIPVRKHYSGEVLVSQLSVPLDPYGLADEYFVIHLKGQKVMPGMP